jgi:hypothetical protein
MKDELTIIPLSRFSWAHCHLQELEELFEIDLSVSDNLRAVPQSFKKLYAQILDGIPRAQRRPALDLLRWVAYAQTPITLSDLMGAPESDAHDRGDVHLPDSVLSRDIVLDIVSELVVVVKPAAYLNEDFGPFSPRDLSGSSSRVQMRHSSVLRFLQSASTKWYHFDAPREHGRIADSCLAYLDRYSRSPKKDGNEKDLDTFRFVKYASENWYLHSRQRGENANVSPELSFLTSSSALRSWLWVHDPAEPSRRPFQAARKANPDTGFIYACLCGLAEVARGLLEKGIDVNEKGNYLGSAIQAASAKGHIEVVKLLVAYGADVNLRAGRNSSPIVGAPLEVTRLLLDHGANVNAGGEPHDSAIYTACVSGEVEVAKLLLKRGVNINVVDDESGSLIQTASAHGHVEVVKLLLAYGADVDVHEGHSRTPSEIAVDKRDRRLTELPVRVGAVTSREDLAQLALSTANGKSNKVERLMNRQTPTTPRSMEDPVIEDMD